jgi:hypothetical protein
VGYRLGKWARRHRAQLVTAACLALAASGAVGVGLQRHLAGISAQIVMAGSEQERYQAAAEALATKLASLPADDPQTRGAAVDSLRQEIDSLGSHVDALVVTLRRLQRAPLQGQRERAIALTEAARDVDHTLAAAQERVSDLIASRTHVAAADALLDGSVPALEAAAVAAIGSSLDLRASPEVPPPAEEDPERVAKLAAALRELTGEYAGRLRESRRRDLTAVESEGALEALDALDEALTRATRAAFTAYSLAGSESPEAARAEGHIEACQAARARVRDATERVGRQRLAAQLAQDARALLRLYAATPLQRSTRTVRLRAAGMAQALVQLGLEVDPTPSDEVRQARLEADVAYALALLDTKSFDAFDEFISREGSFDDAQRDRLQGAKSQRLEQIAQLRGRLRGGTVKIDIQGGSGITEVGNTSKPQLQVISTTGKLRQLAKLADHPLMDDELEALRQEAVSKAERALALAKAKLAVQQVDEAIAAVREQTEALSPAERAEQVSVLAKAWEGAEKRLDRNVDALPPPAAAARRKAIVTGLAALYRDSALILAESAPARARTMARQAVTAITRLHEAGQAPLELVEAYQDRLGALLRR